MPVELNPPQPPAPPGDAQTPSPSHPERSSRTRTLGAVLTLIRFGPGVILVALIVAMALLSPFFLTERNLQNLGAQTSIIAALALGQLLVIVAKAVDVSVGSVVALSAVVGVTVVGSGSGANGFLLILAILAAGLAAGAVNGLIIVKGKLPQPLIVTVATLGIARGLSLLLTDGTPVVGLPPALDTVGSSFIGPVPTPVVIVAVAAGLIWLLANRTQWGRWIYAVGGDSAAAERVGIPVGKVTFSVFALSGLMAGLAGLLTAGRTDSATPLAGQGLELDAITAVIIGGASLFGGRGTVAGALIGALILGVIRNGLDLLSVQPFYQAVAIGVIVIVALELDVVRGRLEDRLRVAESRERSAA